jgi:hypothetical protein
MPRSLAALSRTTTFVLAALLGAAPTAPRAAAAQAWTDWTAFTPSSGTTSGGATGTLAVAGGPVTVSYVGDVHTPTQTACGVDYWAVNPSIYVAPEGAGIVLPPRPCDVVSLIGGPGRPAVQTLTFSAPVTNPFLAVLSLGQPGVAVTYGFSAPFVLLNAGPGYFGGGALFADGPSAGRYVLRGIEGHGLVLFQGTFTSIDWVVPTGEDWHGFTVGAFAQAAVITPEPSSVVLLVTGLVAIAGLAPIARRRVRRLS